MSPTIGLQSYPVHFFVQSFAFFLSEKVFFFFFELLLLLFPPPKWWDWRYASLYLAYVLLGMESRASCMLSKHSPHWGLAPVQKSSSWFSGLQSNILSLCIGLARAGFLRTLAASQASTVCWALGKSHAQKESPRALDGCLYPCSHVKTKDYLKRRTWKISWWSQSWFQLCSH